MFPVFWQYDGRDTQYDGKSSEVYVFLDILRSGGFLPVEKEEFEQTIRRDKVLRKKQLDLRDSEKTPFMFDLTREPDLSSLPADRISSLECLERARGGDADSCLAMVTNVSSSKLIFADILTWRQTRDREYWLSRAESLGRPGACFLKQLIAGSRMPPEWDCYVCFAFTRNSRDGIRSSFHLYCGIWSN